MFPTANKRTAAVSTELFLYENGFTLNYKRIEDGASTNELTDLLIGIGANNLSTEDSIDWFNGHCSKKSYD
jgi:prophage maintenance system killer protein